MHGTGKSCTTYSSSYIDSENNILLLHPMPKSGFIDKKNKGQDWTINGSKKLKFIRFDLT